MRKSLIIKIKKRTQPEFLIWLIFLMPFLFGTLFDLLSLPNVFKYILDIAWLFLLVLIIINFKRNTSLTKRNIVFYILFACFVSLTLVVYLFNFQSPFYYLWGVRNNFRFFVFFFACITFLKKEDISEYLRLFDILFWINSAVSLIQYFVFNKYGDNLGGIFGIEVGCNRYTNVFFIIITAKSIIYYLNKRESLWQLITKSAVMVIIAALAELKFFYMEFVIIIAVAVLIADFSYRNLFVIVGGMAVVVSGAYLLGVLFPGSSGFLSIDSILKIAASNKGYTSSGDLNRLTAIPIISEKFLTSIPEKLFGFGLGNCDTATYDFLVTPFYTQYSNLRYDWFSIAFIFLETGYFGLLFYFGFFIMIFIKSRKTACGLTENRIYSQISALIAMSCIMLMFYNASLRTESAYMVYFILALPFISSSEKKQNL